jgi:hypothetical protein
MAVTDIFGDVHGGVYADHIFVEPMGITRQQAV